MGYSAVPLPHILMFSRLDWCGAGNSQGKASRDVRVYRWYPVGIRLGNKCVGISTSRIQTDIPFLSHSLFEQDGFVFRIRVAYQREPQILKEVRSPQGMISLRDTPASLCLERETRHLPLLTSALHG